MINPDSQTPKSLGYRMPAEWETQEAVWISWPHNLDTWPAEMMGEVENSYVQLVKALHSGQKVRILVNNEQVKAEAKDKLSENKIDLSNIIFCQIKNQDAWMRDCGPTFVVSDTEKKLAMVKQKLADLTAIESALQKLIFACKRGKDGCGCPIIENLTNG